MFFSKKERDAERLVALSSAFNGAVAILAGILILVFVSSKPDITVNQLLAQSSFRFEAYIPRIFSKVLELIGNVHPFIVALLAIVYAIVRYVEFAGLWIGARWGELVCTWSVCIYIPFEIESMIRHLNYFNTLSLVINIVILVFMLVILHRKRLAKKHLV